MSYEAARSAVAAFVNTSWAAAATGTVLEMDNIESIDHSTRDVPFATFQMLWRDAQPASLDWVPVTRYDGEARFHIHVPAGQGVKPMTTLADAISSFMKYARVSNIVFLAPRLLPSADYKDWKITPLVVSFFYRD